MEITAPDANRLILRGVCFLAEPFGTASAGLGEEISVALTELTVGDSVDGVPFPLIQRAIKSTIKMLITINAAITPSTLVLSW